MITSCPHYIKVFWFCGYSVTVGENYHEIQSKNYLCFSCSFIPFFLQVAVYCLYLACSTTPQFTLLLLRWGWCWREGSWPAWVAGMWWICRERSFTEYLIWHKNNSEVLWLGPHFRITVLWACVLSLPPLSIHFLLQLFAFFLLFFFVILLFCFAKFYHFFLSVKQKLSCNSVTVAQVWIKDKTELAIQNLVTDSLSVAALHEKVSFIFVSIPTLAQGLLPLPDVLRP